ncbi:MAG: hypothetical protein ABID54_13160 [Pseudomonadota bacterium]
MRKLVILGIITALLLCVGTMAFADSILKAKVESVTTFNDKNGNPCVRIIVNEARTLQGIEYVAGTPVMAFREMVDKVKGLKAGSTLHAVVAERFYQGRKSYTILAMVP